MAQLHAVKNKMYTTLNYFRSRFRTSIDEFLQYTIESISRVNTANAIVTYCKVALLLALEIM